MRLISWNVARAGPVRIPYQVAALAARAPDIVALQEVRINRVAEYGRALQDAGLPHIFDGFDGATGPFTGSRAAGVLVASRWPGTAAPELRAACHLPWPERLLSLAIDAPCGPLILHTVYVPIGFPNRDYRGSRRDTGRARHRPCQ